MVSSTQPNTDAAKANVLKATGADGVTDGATMQCRARKVQEQFLLKRKTCVLTASGQQAQAAAISYRSLLTKRRNGVGPEEPTREAPARAQP